MSKSNRANRAKVVLRNARTQAWAVPTEARAIRLITKLRRRYQARFPSRRYMLYYSEELGRFIVQVFFD